MRAPDISTHGIFISISRRFPQGAVLCIEFRLARMDVPLRARGEARDCLPGFGVGVEFVDLSQEAQPGIEEEMAADYGGSDLFHRAGCGSALGFKENCLEILSDLTAGKMCEVWVLLPASPKRISQLRYAPI